MPPKRKRRPSPPPKGLAAGEHLKRAKLAGNNSSAWGWVDIEVSDPSQITPEHRLMTCGLSRRNRNPFCGNKYVSKPEQSQPTVTLEPTVETANGESENDIIVVSDDEPPNCTKKACKNNPNCLNYLGQDKWEDEGKAREQFLKASDLGFNPMLNARDPDLPVGLKNLGATCYANAFLQVWFRDLTFRNGVYQCQPLQDTEKKFEDSPIFQLQVTFAALQESGLRVYNPEKFAESLKLSTSEQQDAQEFSKLFMSHLDIEFRKQSAPSLKTLISTQFQGQLVYGTICSNCESRSERSNSFLELEINIENNSRLEDRIAALLQDEKLTGDNRYHCSHCQSLQDATRYTELRALPPVLHFSLLRFVYDFASMERKKSKHNLLFPTTLDMGKFLGRRVNTSEDASGERNSHVYELRGVLLHKGASAYHGHYEAQVFDTSSTTWFQFDDDTVTKIDLLGEKRHSSKEIIDILNWSSKRDIFSSKDAYMLVYARKEFWPGNPPTSTEPCNSSISHRGVDEISKTNGSPQPTTKIPSPPPRARDLVRALNTTHYEACEQYLSKEKELNERFFELREWMRSVYLHWGVESVDEDSVIVSRQALEGWLSKPLTRAKDEKSGPQPPGEEAAEVAILSDTLCEHAGTGSTQVSVRSPTDVCETCVKELFTERLYQIQHPRIVAEFDNVCDVKPGETGFWLSKAWLKDWRLQKPRMHVPLYGDAAPDSAEFRGHVRCEHDQLSLVSTARRSISKEACDILLGIFPHWRPLSTTEAFCSTCETIINSSKEDKRELRKKAEDEKARLRHMYDNALIGNTLLLENVPCAVVSAHFVRLWRKWLGRPTDISRPDVVETSTLFCEHGNLVFDPNAPNDWDCNIALIQLSEWVVLEGLYRCGPVVSVEKRIIEDPNGFLDTKFVHPIPVCHDCRMSRRSNYELTDITVRLQSGHVHTEQNSASRSGESCKLESTSLGLRSSMGLRQSKRIRQGRARRENARLTVSKSTTVKDMKIMIQDVLKIPMICQRLFYKNEELEDNTTTVESLGILMNDTLDLREEGEEGESDGGPRKRRAEEKGFGGTLLATSSFTSLSWDAGTSSEGEPLHEATRACPTCTYDNPPENDMCDVCQGQLIGT
ncbi:hypothetical protein EV401DRAFT_2057534 [Pisolithus croceorrhizus]|nr:hypothetical protein EV401DRAFT_2057534 [Pisolithus croceorrhizus]